MRLSVTKRILTALWGALAVIPAMIFAQGSSPSGTYGVVKVASTVPPNGDLNPYGVAMVPRTIGNLVSGNILVSNFNNSANLQGTGTTIMSIAPDGSTSVFAQIDASTLPGQCPGGVGLTTALVVLRTGWVIVGSLPTSDGTSATAQAGCLIVLNNQGAVAETITDVTINGPWDMTALDGDLDATLFVTNVLNGTVAGNGSIVQAGTVVRIRTAQTDTTMPSVTNMLVIGSGFAEKTDPSALVIGPTGVALAPGGLLYVADTLNNRIVSITNAVNRTTDANTGQVFSVLPTLNAPLGMAVRANHAELMVVNGGNGRLIGINEDGSQKSAGFISGSGTPPGAGTLFGLATSSSGLYFVNDGTNTLNLLSNPL
jgi:hypothetical protein